MLEIIALLIIIVFTCIGVWDIFTGTIPHTITILSLIFAIIYGILDKNTEWIISLSLFGIVLLFNITLFFICGEDAVGGGDVKIMSISMLYLHCLSNAYYYLIILSLVVMLGALKCKIIGQKHLRFGPYMALPIIYVVSLNCQKTLSIFGIFGIFGIFSLFFVICATIHVFRRSEFYDISFIEIQKS